MTSKTVSFGGLLLLFVAGRLLYLVLIGPGYLLIYDPGEELYRGTIAQEIVTGLKMPFTEYRADNYSGGSLVLGALASCFFRLFGPTLFALKLAPLLLFTLALVFWYWTVERYAGERAARYFAFMFCFSPPPFTAYSVTAMGFHSESIFFSALTVFLLFRMLSDDKCSLAYPALLGLTAGFGLWFAYIYGLTLLALLSFWFWQDNGVLWRARFVCFALGFVVGFSPWIIMNLHSNFAGLVVSDANVWEHFGPKHLLDGLSNPRKLVPYEFFANLASDDPRDVPRRAVNLFYSILFVGPILTAGVLRLKAFRSEPAGDRPNRLGLEVFGTLYLLVFALAVQFSAFKEARYYTPAYPFLFFFAAHSIARCQDTFPLAQKKIQTVFLAILVLLGIGAHAPVFSLERPGYTLSAKGYSYGLMPGYYSFSHQTAGSGDRGFILQLVQRPFLSDIVPKLSSEDQRELSRALVRMLALVAPLNGQAGEFSRIERLVPPRLTPLFYYWLGIRAMDGNGVEKAVGAVKFLELRSPTLHRLALIGIYRVWPQGTALDTSPQWLADSPAGVAPELQPHYWRGLGHLAGRYWYDKDRSLSQLNAHVQSFVPRLDSSVQRYFLQGIGELLFDRLVDTPWVPRAERAQMERFPEAYRQGLFEGWGMALGESDLLSGLPWKGHASPYWLVATQGLSERSKSYVQQGKAQFEALFANAGANSPRAIRSHPGPDPTAAPVDTQRRP